MTLEKARKRSHHVEATGSRSLQETIPAEVAEFMRDRITSVGLLESLLYLHARPSQWLTARDVSDGLRTSQHAETQNLDVLCHHGLLDVRVRDAVEFRFAPANETLRRGLERTADCYRTKRVAVIDLIYARPAQSGPSSARAFADAFDFKKRR